MCRNNKDSGLLETSDMSEEMFTPYNAGSFGNFTSYRGGQDEDFGQHSSAFPSDATADADQDVTSGGEYDYDLDYSPTTTTSNPHVSSGYRQPPAVASPSSPAVAVAAPPVYSPIVPPVQSGAVDPRSHAAAAAAAPHGIYDNSIIPRPIPPQNPLDRRTHRSEGYENQSGTGDDSLSLTPQQRKRLQYILAQHSADMPPVKGARYHHPQAPSYWTRAWGRRREILKLLMLALVIVFALGAHSAIVHYISSYVENLGEDSSPFTEMAVRFAYPALIFFLIWVIKVHVTRVGA